MSRAGVAAHRRRDADPADRPGLGSGRRGHDERRLRARSPSRCGRWSSPGDEVIFLSPPWFFYELLILAAGGEPVRVELDPPAFDLDLGRHRGRHHVAHAGRHRQQPAQPERSDLLRRPSCARWPTLLATRVGAHRPSDLDHQRRAVQPDRVRRPRVQLARPSTTRTRSSPTRTARPCWRRGSASAT